MLTFYAEAMIMFAHTSFHLWTKKIKGEFFYGRPRIYDKTDQLKVSQLLRQMSHSTNKAYSTCTCQPPFICVYIQIILIGESLGEPVRSVPY